MCARPATLLGEEGHTHTVDDVFGRLFIVNTWRQLSQRRALSGLLRLEVGLQRVRDVCEGDRTSIM